MGSERLFTGARAILKDEEGNIVACTGITVDRSFQEADYNPCGTPITEAKALVGVQVTLRCERVVLLPAAANDSVALGLTPGSDPITITTWAEKNYTVTDKVDGKVIGKIIGCQPTNEGLVQVNSRALAGANIAWSARNWQPASELGA